MAVSRVSPSEILRQMSFSKYISKPAELEDVEAKCKALLTAQRFETYDRPKQVQLAADLVRTIWKKYDCEEIADIYDGFVKIEEALYGLERDEDSGKRYRDHFVHMVNCYFFGLRIINGLEIQLPPLSFKTMFKIEDENLKSVGLPFGRNYNCKQRVFYLWTLIATFHDIAIPFQHLLNIGGGIDKFIKKFGWTYKDAEIKMGNYDSSQLREYFDVLSKLYGCRLQLAENGLKYATSEQPTRYLSKALGREFDTRNHGVLSGFFMWKTIEEIWLLNKSTNYKLSTEQFDSYSEYVLHQDIARAALAISLHNIQPASYENLFPIKFREYPLTYILILSDELQEYLRWEGVSIEKEIKFSYHPTIKMSVTDGDQINFSFGFSYDSKNRQHIVQQADKIARYQNRQKDRSAKHEDRPERIRKIKDAVELIGNSLKNSLEEKLDIGNDVKIELSIYCNWNRRMFHTVLSSN